MWYRKKEKKKGSMTLLTSEIRYIFFSFCTMYIDAKSGGNSVNDLLGAS